MLAHLLRPVRRTIVEAVGPFVIVEVPGGYVVEDRDVRPALELAHVGTFTEARLVVAAEIEAWARQLPAVPVSRNS